MKACFFFSTAVETSSWIYAPISSERRALGQKVRTVSGRPSIMFCSLYHILFASDTILHLFIYFHLQHWARRFSVGLKCQHKVGRYEQNLAYEFDIMVYIAIVRLCLPLPLSPHPYMVLPVSQSLLVQSVSALSWLCPRCLQLCLPI